MAQEHQSTAKSTDMGNPGDGTRRRMLIIIAVGVVSGLLAGLFGIGGGTIIVPALVWVGLTQRNAAATSVAAIIPTSVSGVASYSLHGDVDWIAALLLALGMIIGSQIGSWLLALLSELVLRWAYVAFLVFVIISQLAFTPSRYSTIDMSVITGVLLFLLGIVIGTLAGLLGIGGGAIAVPALSLLFGASDLIARGTSLLAMFPSAITGTAANLKRRLVHLRDGLVIGIAAAVVAPLGTLIATSISARLGANLFALYLFLLLVRCTWTALTITPGVREKLGHRSHQK